MPEYQYKCKNCDTEFSIIKSMMDTVQTHCPKCKTSQVQRVFFAPSIILKGKGFYKTDNAKPLTDK